MAWRAHFANTQCKFFDDSMGIQPIHPNLLSGYASVDHCESEKLLTN